MISTVVGQHAQRHHTQGHYAQEISPERKLRTRKLSYSKRLAAIFFTLLFEEVVNICCMALSLRSRRQVATLRHGHMARRSASLRSCI